MRAVTLILERPAPLVGLLAPAVLFAVTSAARRVGGVEGDQMVRKVRHCVIARLLPDSKEVA